MDRHSWCPKCREYIHNNQVTFEETHDGCGAMVMEKDPEEKLAAFRTEVEQYKRGNNLLIGGAHEMSVKMDALRTEGDAALSRAEEAERQRMDAEDRHRGGPFMPDNECNLHGTFHGIVCAVCCDVAKGASILAGNPPDIVDHTLVGTLEREIGSLESQLCRAREALQRIRSVNGTWCGFEQGYFLASPNEDEKQPCGKCVLCITKAALSSSSPCPHEARIKQLEEEIARYHAREQRGHGDGICYCVICNDVRDRRRAGKEEG